MCARCDRCHGPSCRDGELVAKPGTGRGYSHAIALRVRDHQQDRGLTAVAQLERDASDLCLRVRESGFHLDRQGQVGSMAIRESSDPAIPGTLIRVDGKWHLGSEHETGCQASPESSEQLQLSGIAQRVRAGIRAEANIETHHGANSGDLVDAGVTKIRTLDPADLRTRQAGATPDDGLREPGCDAGVADLAADATEVGSRQPRATIGRSFTCRHRPIME
jgi:hypothetical protein